MRFYKAIIIVLIFVLSLGFLSTCFNNTDVDFESFFSFILGGASIEDSNDISTSESTEKNSEILTESTVTEDDSEDNTENIELPDVDNFSKLTYVAFGDSITYGADRYNGNTGRMDYPYPSLVCESLGLLSMTNNAVNGATFCSNNLNRVCMTDRILAYTEQSDIISIMLGVNDFSASLPLGDIDDKTSDTIYGALNLICEHLTTTQDSSFIFFMTPYKCSYYENSNALGYTLEDVVEAIYEVTAVYDIPVLDMFNQGQYELEMYFNESDGVHPSQEFIREYTAPQIVEFIKNNYK